ncbi:MAG: LytR C-terminal domain-containing protein [Candidatus Sphingomonas colombiensis]|nr:LytR C-terminal domain-containing protein [Sphingomonas sp.]WEK42503.1 MAG: LytR C-terminal domain-containing protein [Sphingomonas sp.]
MRRDTFSWLMLSALLATAGCSRATVRADVPEGTRFTADAKGSADKAARLLTDGNYGLAIEMYRRMVAIDPDDAGATAGLARCYDRLQRYDLSEVYFQKALALAPRDPALYRAYGASLRAQGRQAEAELLAIDMDAMLAPAGAAAAVVANAGAGKSPAPTRDAEGIGVVLASVAAVPPAPPALPGQRLERVAPGVVRLVMPQMRYADIGRPSAAAGNLQVVPPVNAPLRNTLIVNAVGRKGIAGRVQSYLSGRGWQSLDRGDAKGYLTVSRILYPPAEQATAKRLAQAVPFRTRLYPLSQANRVQLLIGENAIGFDKAKPVARR